ncbi:MAG: glycine cleavage system aminomethyltransferase GcvT [Deltaproteobacteria bacterium]|nr:glycine cleavage system aminomethyltransferase GcvT [Deltaproteobacteria bacterium]
MTEATAAAPRKTPLYDVHKRLGGKIIDFGGWALPVNYAGGILAEHAATRNAIGVFDVSHMGEFHFRGARAVEALQALVTNDVARLADGQALYTVACNPAGGIVDDLIVYRIAPNHFLTVVNAANIDKDLAWFKENTGGVCSIDNESDGTALIAYQGPKAIETLETLGAADLSRLPSFGLRCDVEIAGHATWVARTGYTGEDGVEIFCAPSDAPSLFEALVQAAAAQGGGAAGLGARDTLRLEAKLPLYGNDLSDATSPLEAGLGWVVKFDKGPFIGSQALAAQKAAGLQRRLVGFVMKDRGIARHGYPVLASENGQPAGVVGEVTSGGVGPTVGKNVGMAYVPSPLASQNTQLFVDCRGKTVPAEVVTGPFYRRSR